MKPSWVSASIKEIFEIKYGKGLPEEYRNSSGSVSVYGSNGVIGKHDKSITAGPTIVIGRKGSVGEVNLSTENCWPIDTTYFIDSFPCDLPPKYWMLYLKSLKIGQHDKSTAIPGISRDDVYGIRVPLPPLNEQRRIVAKLEKLLGKVDACKERLERIPTILKRFRQSVLAAACSGRLTADWREKNKTSESVVRALNPKDDCRVIDDTANSYDLFELPNNWIWVRIRDICDVRGGKRLPKGEKLVKENTGFPYLKAGNLKEGTVIADKLEYLTPEVQKKIKMYTVNAGDAYITIVGACIGDAGIIPKEFDGANLTENAVKICNINGIHNRYLSNWLRSTICQDFIKQTILSAAQGKLALGRIKMLPVTLPSIQEQQEIVRRVEALFKVADKIEERYKKAKVYVDKLTQSILAKAFRGELVPQDPNDEPASALLERIREERSKKADKSQTAKTKNHRRQRRQNQLQMDI